MIRKLLQVNVNSCRRSSWQIIKTDSISISYGNEHISIIPASKWFTYCELHGSAMPRDAKSRTEISTGATAKSVISATQFSSASPFKSRMKGGGITSVVCERKEHGLYEPST